MALKIVTKPTFYPVSLDEAKDRLRITNETEDDQVYAMIVSATLYAEKKLNWRLCTQTWDYFLDEWPNEYTRGLSYIRLPYPPLQSITHVKYYDENNTLQPLVEDTNYRIDTSSYPARIEAITSWPSYYSRFNAINIRFVCGFDSSDDINEDIKDAIHLRIADLYENRQNSYVAMGASLSISQNTETSENILAPYVMYNEP